MYPIYADPHNLVPRVLSYPGNEVVIHIQDWRSAALFRYKNRAEITHCYV